MKLQRWKQVADLLAQGWTVEGYDVVSPTGERLDAWINAIDGCAKRGLIVPRTAKVEAPAIPSVPQQGELFAWA